MANEIRVEIETTDGTHFEAFVPGDTPLNQLAADFFDAQGWPTEDAQGRRQRAVVDLVNPSSPEDTKRLNAERTIEDAGVQDGDVLRIFPESIAGAVDHRARTTALIGDHNAMQALVKRNRKIKFEPNRSHAPDQYTITFNYTSFTNWQPGDSAPQEADEHTVEITLGASYPRSAPRVQWKTPIFHPNIRQSDGAVCLGVLRERYLPGLGLARLVHMLAEMVQWANFDPFNPFNKEAADWAKNPENWDHIIRIGGSPFQGPIQKLIEDMKSADRSRIEFRRIPTSR